MISRSIIDNNHENKLVKIINDSIMKNNKESITINTKSLSIDKIYNTSKFSGLSHSYTDILFDSRTRKPYFISLENPDLEFIIKTDANGLNIIQPGIIVKFIDIIRRNLTDDTDITKFNGQLSLQIAEKLIKGITVLGGPVDYYFFDNSEFKYEFNDNEIYFNNAYFMSPKELAANKTFYLKFNSSSEQYINYIKNNRFDLIKHDISIVQESDSDAKIININ